VLLLSEFAGAAEEMAEGAMIMNPYDPEACALKLRDALTLPVAERQAAIRRLQGGMKTIYDWMADLFTRWGDLTAEMPASGGLPLSEEMEELFAVGRGTGGYSDDE
jgi:trehalose 6-phosphate synthase